ncbi:MAG: 16S rRNA (guanine(527)-N(7))-methyltransferase RsmG [Vulcanimicrobiaceae bacterium]
MADRDGPQVPAARIDPADRSALEESLAAAGVERALGMRLAEYGARVLAAGRTTNLTGARTPQALAEHLLDSLTLVPYVRGPLVDVGAGAGLPGIPLALACGISVTLVESQRKKARFLAEALEALALDGEVVAERAEVAARDARLRERFAAGTARALGSAPTVAEFVLPFIAPGGVALLQRGALAERERIALADACLVLGGELEAEVPLAGERRILIVRKIAPTPKRFPRRSGVPGSRPLCGNGRTSAEP